MGLFPVNAFIGRAIGAKAVFDGFDKPVGDAALVYSGPRTDRAFHTTPGHLSVFFGNGTGVHKAP